MRAQLVGISIGVGNGEAYYIPVKAEGEVVKDPDACDRCRWKQLRLPLHRSLRLLSATTSS